MESSGQHFAAASPSSQAAPGRQGIDFFEESSSWQPLRGGGKGGPPSGSADQNLHADGHALVSPPSAHSSRSTTPGPDGPRMPDASALGSLLGTERAGSSSSSSGGNDGGDGSSSSVTLGGLDPALVDAERLRQEQEDLIDNETNLWRLRNFSIPVFYCILGFALRYPTVALRRFMIDTLHVAPAMQSLVVGVVMYLPFSMKIFFAFLSDGVPILGQRRKPYMLGGVIMAAAAWITLGALEKPSIDVTAMLLFIATLGIVWCDTMVDTLVVERMRHEHGPQVGKMQTLCWMLRYGGMFVGILVGGWLLRYGSVPPSHIFLSLGCVLIIVLFPSMIPLADEGMRNADGTVQEPPAFSENVERIWQAVQLNSIWKPMIFVYIWNILPNDGDAWVNFLLKKLRFSDDEYSYILAIGTLSGALGALLYRTCLRNTPLHPIFYVTIIVSALLSCIPFLLIFRVNRDWGLPDFAFAMGNEVINDVAGFIMYMPVLIMCSKLCPDQVEGSVYALTCVVNNIGAQIAMNFSSLLTDEFNITLENYDNLWQLHLVVVLFMFIPLFFVPLTPNRPGDGNPDEVRRLADRVELKLNARRAKRQSMKIAAAAAGSSSEAAATGSVLAVAEEQADAAAASSLSSSLAAAEARATEASAAGRALSPAPAGTPPGAGAPGEESSGDENNHGALAGESLIRRRRGDGDSADPAGAGAGAGAPASAGSSSSSLADDDESAPVAPVGETAPLTGTQSRSDDSVSTPNREHDGDAAAAAPNASGRRCCAACSCCEPLDEEEVVVDEAAVTDAQWAVEEQKLANDLVSLREKASTMVQPSSKYGGGLFLTVIFGSLLWSTGDAAWRLSHI